MTRIALLGTAFAVWGLAGCQHKLTMEEARALCTQQGGFLMVIQTQKITLSGVGREIESPGDCVSAKSFDAPAPANQISAPPAPPAPAP